MKIIEAIHQLDDKKPNTYSQEDKVKWLSALDLMVSRNVIETHFVPEDYEPFEGYTIDTSLETELIVPAPYDEMYITWLESKVDYYNGEYAHYNNSILHFNETFGAFSNDYNRHHRPLPTKARYW